MERETGWKPVSRGASGPNSAGSSKLLPWSASLISLLLASIAALLAMSAVASWNLRTQRIDADWVQHTERVRFQLSRILQLLIDAQTGARGYALLESDRALKAYNAATPLIGPSIERLSELISDNPNQRAQAARLSATARDLQDLDAAVLSEAQQGNPAQVRSLLSNGRIDDLMASARGLLADMQGEEDRLLIERRVAQDHSRRDAAVALWATGGLGAALLVLAVYLSRKDEAKHLLVERELATTLRSIGDAVIATDLTGVVRFMNPIAEQLTGWTDSSARGQPLAEVFKIIGEESRLPVESPERLVLHEGRRVALANHTILISKDGAERAIADSGAPVVDENGKIQGMVLVFRDVSEDRSTERSLRLRDAELQIINDHARFPIARCDPQHHFLFVNKAYAHRLGVKPEDCVGKHIREIAGEAAYQSVLPYINETLSGRVVEFETEIPYSGNYGSRWMRCIYAPVADEQGKISSFVAAVTDITEKKHAEKEQQRLLQAVEAEKERLSLVLRSINDEVWFVDSHGQITLVNASALREFGHANAPGVDVDALVKSLLILRPDGSIRPVHDAPLSRALAGEVIVGEEEIIQTPRTGELRHREVYATPVRDHSGQIVGAVAVVRDITQHKRAQAALRDADRRKDEFIATLSHELRNPLAPIRTAAKIIAAPQLAPEKLRQAQLIIERQVTHMALLLDDLLDIARITQGKLRLKKERITLSDAVDAAIESVRPTLDGKNHHLSVSLPAQAITLEADPLRLVQILSNLLMNAAKYSNPGSHIEVQAGRQANSLSVSVKDDGIGLAPESISRIFEMFSQIDGVGGRSEGGLGIGLALVKGLAELHGGTVEARSAGLGQGSEFIVRLPVSNNTPTLLPRLDPTQSAVERRRVLIADDNRDAAVSLSMLLELSGHEVRVAHLGQTALSLAQTFRPDAAVLDIGMPDLSGYEIAQALRQEAWARDLQLIALTGWGQDDDRRRALEAGFDHHLTKPVDPEQLESLIAGRSPAAS
jgi:PAS domain S-box-containing protein